MKRIIYIPIESLEERYSAQWNKWFPEHFNKNGIDYIMIDPPVLTSKIETGSFLDVCSTNYYKSLQTAELCKMIYNKEITSEDVLFYADVWNPGISHLAYIRDGLGMKFKIVGCLFAGSYDPFDFLAKKGMGYWAEHLENSWFRIIDKFFIATEFHKRLIRDARDIDPKKMIVTGHPTIFDWGMSNKEKERIVVFPHRLDSEKHPELFDTFTKEVQKKIGAGLSYLWSFIKTKEVTNSKKEYFSLLERANISVSFAEQETWGFAMIESIFARCLPLVPDRLSYSEMYNPCFKYASFNEAVDIVVRMIKEPELYATALEENRNQLLIAGSTAIEKMINECNSL